MSIPVRIILQSARDMALVLIGWAFLLGGWFLAAMLAWDQLQM